MTRRQFLAILKLCGFNLIGDCPCGDYPNILVFKGYFHVAESGLGVVLDDATQVHWLKVISDPSKICITSPTHLQEFRNKWAGRKIQMYPCGWDNCGKVMWFIIDYLKDLLNYVWTVRTAIHGLAEGLLKISKTTKEELWGWCWRDLSKTELSPMERFIPTTGLLDFSPGYYTGLQVKMIGNNVRILDTSGIDPNHSLIPNSIILDDDPWRIDNVFQTTGTDGRYRNAYIVLDNPDGNDDVDVNLDDVVKFIKGYLCELSGTLSGGRGLVRADSVQSDISTLIEKIKEECGEQRGVC